MSLSSILSYIGVALAILALLFLLIGALRTDAPSNPPCRGRESLSRESQRLKAIRRADWRCAASLLFFAFLAFVLSLIGRPFFTESSGNIAGGALLIAALVALLLVLVLIIRYIELSRALHALDDRGE